MIFKHIFKRKISTFVISLTQLNGLTLRFCNSVAVVWPGRSFYRETPPKTGVAVSALHSWEAGSGTTLNNKLSCSNRADNGGFSLWLMHFLSFLIKQVLRSVRADRSLANDGLSSALLVIYLDSAKNLPVRFCSVYCIVMLAKLLFWCYSLGLNIALGKFSLLVLRPTYTPHLATGWASLVRNTSVGNLLKKGLSVIVQLAPLSCKQNNFSCIVTFKWPPGEPNNKGRLIIFLLILASPNQTVKTSAGYNGCCYKRTRMF